MIEKCTRILANANSIVDYQVVGNKDAKNVILLLHGFGENSEIIREKFEDLVNDDYMWVIPNGTFPIIKKRANAISYKFAWYFYNNNTQKHYIDFTYSTEVLKSFIKQIDTLNRPLTVIGYSQGGYLAPFVGQSIAQTTKVIGINCNFRDDMLDNTFDFDLCSIHGKKDAIVDFNKSYNSHLRIRNSCPDAIYISLENGTHELSQEFMDEVRKIIS